MEARIKNNEVQIFSDPFAEKAEATIIANELPKVGVDSSAAVVDIIEEQDPIVSNGETYVAVHLTEEGKIAVQSGAETTLATDDVKKDWIDKVTKVDPPVVFVKTDDIIVEGNSEPTPVPEPAKKTSKLFWIAAAAIGVALLFGKKK